MTQTNIKALLSNENNEWFTPAIYVEAARRVLGKIDLDPASCAEANLTVQATRYYSQSDNGLLYPWPGRVWLNCPYGKTNGKSNQEIWSYRLMGQYIAGITTEAIMLVNASTDTAWFQRLARQYPVCLTDHRISFRRGVAGNDSGPTHGSAFFYLGHLHEKKFFEVFRQFGLVLRIDSGDTLPTMINLDLWSIDMPQEDSQQNTCVCGADLPTASGRGRPAQFCTEKCANRVRKQRQRERETQHQ